LYYIIDSDSNIAQPVKQPGEALPPSEAGLHRSASEHGLNNLELDYGQRLQEYFRSKSPEEPEDVQRLPAQVDSDREATMGHGAMDLDMDMMDMDGCSDSGSAMDIDRDETTDHNPIPQRFNADTCTTGMPDSEIDMPVPNFEPSPPVETIINSADSHWFWCIIMILITWLHLYYHLPHCGCNLILGVLRRIFVQAGMLTDESGVSETL